MSPPTKLGLTLQNATERLRATVDERGAFCGELSSSALSTATASMALAMSKAPGHAALAAAGHAWLERHQNPDGGWGDTIDSPSNISTTLLCWASLATSRPANTLAPERRRGRERAAAWLVASVGGALTPARIAQTIRARYGTDQTFSVPILTTCAIAGQLGVDGWRFVPSLPFELAACPHRLLHLLKLNTVSYALPALIAIGQVRHHHRPSRNPITRLLRSITKESTLRKLARIQPASGGFLEAAPLTSFVVMALLSMQRAEHPVVANGLRFLRETVRPDGSWPIDTNLDTWLTTLSVHALGSAAIGASRDTTLAWLIAQQYREVHPYTRAAPGGWAWTDLTGGVPDADDTAGALLALRHLDPTAIEAAAAGVTWLCDLTNDDGGVPTFCRGWGRLPFDQSSPDITAHALRAWHAWSPHIWSPHIDAQRQRRVERAIGDAIDYLLKAQRDDGSFIPLWFGSQLDDHHENPVYGTSRVVLAIATVPGPLGLEPQWIEAGARGVRWLGAAQNDDGGYGSVEETALAVEALSVWYRTADLEPTHSVRMSIDRGLAWLVDKTELGTRFDPAPIGLYFAKLWYSEKLYPLVFTVAALAQAQARDASAIDWTSR